MLLRGYLSAANYTERATVAAGETNADFCRFSVFRATDTNSRKFLISRSEPLILLPCTASVILTRLSGRRSGTTSSQKICYRRESNSEPLDLQSGYRATRP
jgi:hypothetical protein